MDDTVDKVLEKSIMFKKNHNEPNRREYFRLDSVFPIDVFLPEKISGKKFIQGFTHDVSAGGLCLIVNDPDPSFLSMVKQEEDETFDININMLVSRKPIEANVKIIWYEFEDKGRHTQLRVGLFYEKIAPNDKRKIINAARRKTWLPKLSALLIVLLLGGLAVNNYYTGILEKKNKALIVRFYNMQEKLDKYSQREATINKEYAKLSKAIKDKTEAINSLKDQIINIQTTKDENWQSEKQRLESKLFSIEKERQALEKKSETIIEKKNIAEKLIKQTKQEREKLYDVTVDNMYKWIKTHQNRYTGLVASFEGYPVIRDWGFTYDEALACIVFLQFNNVEDAKHILSFYKNKAKKHDGGYFNAYNARTGSVSEPFVFVGPNLWIAIAALQYTHITGDDQFLEIAKDVADWTIKLKTKDGGIPGGPKYSWYSTEHNIDAYAVFDMLYILTKNSKYEKEKQKTLQWLKDYAYSVEEKRMNRGKGDATIATDTMAWAVAALGPGKLLENQMDPDEMIKFAERYCAVKVKFKRPDGKKVNVSGFDFSKAQNISRGGVVSPEWTAQMIVTYQMMADYYIKLNDNRKAQEYSQKAEYYLSNLNKMVISSSSKTGQGAGCLPYASLPNADTGHGWRTPKGEDTGSVAGTAYAIFAHKDFNPLALE